MEYVQMTLDDWLDLKRKLRQEITSVKRSFVRIGCALHRIRDERLYEQDGYKSVGEFAREEYGCRPYSSLASSPERNTACSRPRSAA